METLNRLIEEAMERHIDSPGSASLRLQDISKQDPDLRQYSDPKACGRKNQENTQPTESTELFQDNANRHNICS